MKQLPLLALVLALFASTANAAELPNPTFDDALAKTSGSKTITVAGGCFWGVQAVFQHVKGVQKAVSGYDGGSTTNPSYETVSTGATGHAESVQVTYDPSQVTLGQLLKVFFSVAHDPTTLNSQGPDHGTQYRSAVFYGDATQKRIAQAYVDQLQTARIFPAPIVTQIAADKGFFPAEAYHQDYARLHPGDGYIVANDAPKVENLKKLFPALYSVQ